MDLDTLQNRHQALLAAGHHHTASARSGKFAKIILRFGIGPDCSTHAQKQPRPRRSKKLRRPAESGKCPAGVLRFSCNSDAFRVELTLSLHTMNFASALVLLTLLCKCLIRLYTRRGPLMPSGERCLQMQPSTFNCASNETLILCSGHEQMYSHKYDGHVKTYIATWVLS